MNALRPTIESEQPLPQTYLDEGTYSVVSDESTEVLSGTYRLHTSAVAQSGKDVWWETMLSLNPENVLVTVNEDDPDTPVDDIYDPSGKVWRLWELSEDPNGRKAAEFHEKMLELVKHGISAPEINAAAPQLISYLNLNS